MADSSDKIHLSGWGSDQTEFFFDLTPDRVLQAVEASGLQFNGLCVPLNSYENRVYELELETDESPKSAAERNAHRRVAKFYRPGRWNKEQILEEHQFLREIALAEIPVVAPEPFDDGETLKVTEDGNLYYALFPKYGGRSPDELDDEQREQLGRLIARIHNVGSSKPSKHRISLTPESYGLSNLQFLLDHDWIPNYLMKRYENAVTTICRNGTKWFSDIENLRLHGDCHMGNLLWRDDTAFFLDFDDMVRGPAIQDLWLMITEEGDEGRKQLETILSGYEEMRSFDRSTIGMIEVLRSLRFVHYTAWLARRWEDPTFKAAFPHFNTPKYWEEKTRDLEGQVALCK